MNTHKVTLYGYKKCSTCRKAEQTLSKLGVEYDYIDITERPPSANGLKNVAKVANLAPKKLFNTSGVQYRELNIKDKLPDMNASDIYRLLAGNGRLIKRPITTDGQQATVGYKEHSFLEAWSE